MSGTRGGKLTGLHAKVDHYLCSGWAVSVANKKTKKRLIFDWLTLGTQKIPVSEAERKEQGEKRLEKMKQLREVWRSCTRNNSYGSR